MATTTTEALRTLLSDGFPAWSTEPLHERLADELGVPPRRARELLSSIDVRVGVPPAYLGRLDETWLFRLDAKASARDLTKGLAGLLDVVELEGPYAIMRTLAQDAVEREKLLRALHKAIGERPVTQLHRPVAPLARKPTKEDWALVAALRREPTATLDALAKEARQTPKLAKERLARLAAERVIRLDAEARGVALSHVLLRASPSSTAAARRAFGSIDGLLHAWLPTEGETSYADALVVGQPALDAARDVPGIASLELLPVRARSRDETLIDAALARLR